LRENKLKRESKLYLEDILEAISRINEYTLQRDFNAISKEKITVDAVLRNLEVIGEAATHIPKEIKDKFPEVPWRDISGFRIVVAHHYWKINFDIINDIIKNKLDELKSKINKILKTLL
jgi:uncharacterized protein with HEPN domain